MEGDTRDRWNVDIACRFQWDEIERDGRLLNLLEVGAFVESTNPYLVGSSIGLAFGVEDDEQDFVLAGDIIHAGQYLIRGRNVSGFGVEFIGTPLSTILRLRQFLRQHVIPATTLSR